MRYLDPKNDLTFKLVFGDHKHLLMSFLNSLLPLESPISSLEYLPAELVPENPLFKNSIVDVRCVDERGRQFIVEMQMIWTDAFKSRVLFNASKAYVKQIERTAEYKVLQPVYSLCIINQNFEPHLEEYLHHYKIVHSMDTDKVMEGLEFIFIELPKFKAKKFTEKKLGVLWLRFLSEIEDNQVGLPADLLEYPEIREATELLKESAFSNAQLETYDKYWDSIRTGKTLISGAREEGIVVGEKRGEIKRAIEMALRLIQKNYVISEISELTGLTVKEIENLRNRKTNN